ncbi:MAG: hypothetical protein KDE58_37265, partial [Caldilineaceae bacterium]|nr:hypothetical protein [Caldilineaceae bacterium]
MDALPPIIDSVAGNGGNNLVIDTGSATLIAEKATQVGIGAPRGIAVGPEGSVYFSTPDNAVRRLDRDGVLYRFAGRAGGEGFAGDGELAIQALLYRPQRLAVGPDGSVYIADQLNNRLRKVRPDGVIESIDVQLNQPYDVAVGKDGAIYTVERYTVGLSGSLRSRLLRIDTDNTVTLIASPPSGSYLNAVAVGHDGSIYTSYWDNGTQIRRIDPTGTISTTQFVPNIFLPNVGIKASVIATDMEIDAEGRIYTLDGNCHRIWRIDPDGSVFLLAGNRAEKCQGGSFTGDGGPAAAATLSQPSAIALTPNDELLIADAGSGRVRRISTAAPGLALGDILLPSADGAEVYIFNADGKHLRTLDALTGALLYEFSYTSYGSTRLLTQIVDGDGNVTTLERNDKGTLVAFVSPYGIRTAFNIDDNGYLSSLSNPVGETVTFTYTEDGLLTGLVDPKQNAYTFGYDDVGRLLWDENPRGGVQELAKSISGENDSYTVTRTSAVGRVTNYSVQQTSPGEEKHFVNTFPNGTQSSAIDGRSGNQHSVLLPGGTEVNWLEVPDPRFGMQAPLVRQQRVSTPSGLQSVTNFQRTVTLADPNDPLSLTARSETMTVNGQIYSSVYDTGTKQMIATSPEGREIISELDEMGRVVRLEVVGLAPTTVTYDEWGRLAQVVEGTGETARVTTIAYRADGYVDTITDPLQRVVRFGYDAAGRIISQVMPDARVIGFAYDANGNLQSVIPPGRPAHDFTFTPVDQLAGYVPPDVGIGDTATAYAYDLDGALTQINRPDGQQVLFNYDDS